MALAERPPLTVRERVESVISLRCAEGTLASLTVSELCRLAAVNRASLYAHHRDLIRRVTAARTRSGLARSAKPSRSEADERKQLRSARRQIQALLLTIVELQHEVVALQRRLLGERQDHQEVRRASRGGRP